MEGVVIRLVEGGIVPSRGSVGLRSQVAGGATTVSMLACAGGVLFECARR